MNLPVLKVMIACVACCFISLTAHGETTFSCCDSKFKGFYLGGNFGFGELKSFTQDQNSLNPPLYESFDTSWTAGLQIGYDRVNCNGLLGCVIDWSWIDNENKEQFRKTVLSFLEDNHVTHLDWFSTLRGKAGLSFDHVLLYVTAGAALGSFEYKIHYNETVTPVNLHLKTSKKQWGWTAGIGTELLLKSNWSLNAEILYLNFNRVQSFRFPGSIVDRPTPFFALFEHDNLLIGRIGINYRFNICQLCSFRNKN